MPNHKYFDPIVLCNKKSHIIIEFDLKFDLTVMTNTQLEII